MKFPFPRLELKRKLPVTENDKSFLIQKNIFIEAIIIFTQKWSFLLLLLNWVEVQVFGTLTLF